MGASACQRVEPGQDPVKFERASFVFVAREGKWHKRLVRRSREVAAGDIRVQTPVGEDVP